MSPMVIYIKHVQNCVITKAVMVAQQKRSRLHEEVKIKTTNILETNVKKQNKKFKNENIKTNENLKQGKSTIN